MEAGHPPERDDRHLLPAARRDFEPGADAERYRNVLVPNSKAQADADEYFLDNEPAHASMLRTSVSPNILGGGYRVNVIPSEAKATLDVRMLPDEDPAKFLEQVKKVVNDPTVDVRFGARDTRPRQPDARLDSEAFKALEANVTKHYNAPTLPTMSTGATDMAYLRAKGMQCYGVGPATRCRGRAEGLRRAQRSGTDPRERAVPLRALPLGHRRRPRADEVSEVDGDIADCGLRIAALRAINPQSAVPPIRNKSAIRIPQSALTTVRRPVPSNGPG